MLSHKSIAGLTLLMFSFFIAVGITQSSGAQDFSSETYNVQFMPWANKRIAIRSLDGQGIGYSSGQMTLETPIDGNSLRSSRTPGGIDLTILLRNFRPVMGADKHTYITMSIAGQDLVLEGGVKLPASTPTQPNEVLIDLNDLQITRILQPVSSTPGPDATAPQIAAAENFTNTAATLGATAETAPTNTPADSVATPEDGEDDESEESETAPGGYTNRNLLPEGGSFPSKFLSSPICSNGSINTYSDHGGFGRRGSPDRHGICHAHNGAKMSCVHQGLDIAARRMTPVLATAYGCFLGPGSVKKPTGTLMLGSDLRIPHQSGYGNTLRLYHGNGVVTQYSHLTSVSGKAQWGKCVQRGDVIGYTGNTGQSSGPHLHFGVYKKTARGLTAVNPKPYLLSTTGSFLNPSCRAIPRYPDLDTTMRTSGASRRPPRTSSAGGGSLR